MSKPRKPEPKRNGSKLRVSYRSKMGYRLMANEPLDIVEDLKSVLEDPEIWLDEPNPHFMGRTPRELIGTEREISLRNWIRRVKHGVPS